MRRDAIWPAVEAAGSGLLSVVAAFAIARWIGPEELGIGAAAVAGNVLFWIAANALFADAIVQRPSLDGIARSSACWASFATGCAAAGAQAGWGYALAWMLDEPRLVAMSLVLALPLPLVGLAGAAQGFLTRDRRFRALAVRSLGGQAAGAAAGLWLAAPGYVAWGQGVWGQGVWGQGVWGQGVWGHGAWAPVAQQTVACAVSAAIAIGLVRWRPRAVFRWDVTWELLRIGLPLTASTLVQIGRYRLFALLIGGTAGAAALGHIHMAFRLADSVRDVVFTALWRVFLPVLSVRPHDRDTLLARVDRLLRLSSVATMPLCGGLAIALVPVVELVLGPAWHDAGMAAVPLAGLMGVLALMFPSGVALIAVGQARFTLYANLAGTVATLGLAVLVRPDSPWEAAMVWCQAQLFVTPFSLWANGRALGTGPFRPLRAGVPMAMVAAAAAALALGPAGSSPLETLIWRMGVFGAVVAAGVALLRWPMPREKAGPRGVVGAAPLGRTGR